MQYGGYFAVRPVRPMIIEANKTQLVAPQHGVIISPHYWQNIKLFMQNDAIIKVHINGADEMAALGNLCAAEYLKPLLDSNAPEFRFLIVPLYGDLGIGKSSLATGCCKAFIAPFDWNFDPHVPSKREADGKVFRHYDFGDYAYPSVPDKIDHRHVPEGSKPGIDFMEHCPASFVDRPGLVVAVSKPDSTSFYPERVQDRLSATAENFTPRQQTAANAIWGQYSDCKAITTARMSAGFSEDARIVSLIPNSEAMLAKTFFGNLKKRAKEKFDFV